MHFLHSENIIAVSYTHLAAGNVVEKETQKETAMESETPKDREVEPGGYLTEETTKEKAVNNVVEENTQSNVSKKDYLYGLSSEAAAQIKTLKFNKNSKLIWPVEGSIIMPYDVKNTVYYLSLIHIYVYKRQVLWINGYYQNLTLWLRQ